MSTITTEEKPLTEEDKIKIKETSVFIDSTNRESMEMIKKAILLAINRLQQYKPEDEDKDAYYLKEKDVLAAIELSYDIQVAEYEALREEAIAGITGIPIEDNKQTINGLHKITDEELARATAMFLPASNSSSNNTNNGHVLKGALLTSLPASSNSNGHVLKGALLTPASSNSNGTGSISSNNTNNGHVTLLSTKKLLNRNYVPEGKYSQKVPEGKYSQKSKKSRKHLK